MAKRKAKKKSPSSSSRPPSSRPSSPLDKVILGLPSPTKKHARHSSLPPPPRSLALVLPPKKLKVLKNLRMKTHLHATPILARIMGPLIWLIRSTLPASPLLLPQPLLILRVLFFEVPVTSPPAEKDIGRNVQVSEEAGTLQASVAIASPLVDVGLQDPMVCEAASAVHDWEPVPKKHLSNKQPKMKTIGSGILAAGSALGKDSVAAKGKSVEAVVIGFVDGFG
ncbi:hypothetical protein OIU85_007412 [Salix viminalis]|uniref:Uncharacterized protein n=1 Tax=Salix viminalis TaxID=40686 RepID=A0A9Q0P8X9_SALVM|nr:hypothetical protein OIU85_007412 [Salix viminalis]